MRTHNFVRWICLPMLFLLSHFAIAQNQYDIVIDEIMADPAPQVGLPNAEWIELRNTTTNTINIAGWRIGDGSGISGVLPSYLLKPDSCVVVCTASAVAALAVFGAVVSVTSFPSLDNTGELIFLRSPAGKTIHAVEYHISWFNNAVKSDGGWTLEMIDPKNPCGGGRNWAASTDAKGGTPGKINAVQASHKDSDPPRLLRSFATDAYHVMLVFDEPLDSAKATVVNNFNLSDGIGLPVSASPLPPLFNSVSLYFAAALIPGKIYTVTATAVTDCSGNSIGSFNACKTGLAAEADSLDVVINEILFRPKPNGADYVELYNKGSKIIDLKNLLLANRSSTGVIGSLRVLQTDNYLLFPGEYIVATEDTATVKMQYFCQSPEAFTQITSLPSFPNDKGNVVLLNNAGKIIDELNYSAKWHFALVDNDEGISLERIDIMQPTNQPSNWSSAASSVGFGTPTYRNSQYKNAEQVTGNITVKPAVFSPDNDGFDDFAFIHFTFPEAGYVANISVYDDAGRLVKLLQKNATCGLSGSFRWDGLNDKLMRVPVGFYVIYTEIFNLKGQKKAFKNTVVVARKF